MLYQEPLKRICVVGLLVALAGSGCLPFVLPPLRMEGGGALSTQGRDSNVGQFSVEMHRAGIPGMWDWPGC